jgi:hypothetical protein
MPLLLLIALAWVALALPVALLVGRGLRMADQREEAARLAPTLPNVVQCDLLGAVSVQRREAA